MSNRKKYTLVGADEKPYLSEEKRRSWWQSRNKGLRQDGLPGRAAGAAFKGSKYLRSESRLFKDEATALAVGYRPCGGCLREQYKLYKDDPEGYRQLFGVKG